MIFTIFSTCLDIIAIYLIPSSCIVAALYGKSHPEYAGYLYLVAPVNLIFLNPIAFMMMEISKQKEVERLQMEADGAKGLQYERPKMVVVVRRVLKGILFNPIIIMTVLGICGNLAFHHCVPTILEGILKVIVLFLYPIII